ncbi:B12-binding domain-containing radical SAM protein [Desulfospira joergensenii]|uniref:B12-binding domain-containing radical SAM protein n=1 Tax=Desulfospira joergensenii TaxID=53329 RepID=UPI0003B52376|nr:radical SAM protein [Desulfospira joergensenii]
MKKILFVNPACLDRRVTDEDATMVPIGLFYLAALMMENGFETRILNLAQCKTKEAGEALTLFESVLEKEKPDIIGFSVTNPNRHQAMECAERAKKILDPVSILFGGPAPTFMAEFFMGACPDLDFIVRGEGETACLELVRALDEKDLPAKERLSRIKGLVFRDGSGIRDTGPGRGIDDLDSLPHPSRYFRYHHLAMSRGCPGKCTFCGSPRFWGKSGVRFHSAQWFADEVRALAEKGVSHFFISDDTFTMDRDRVMEFCRLISDLSITWNAISRVDFIDRELLIQMRKAGCIQISFGVESGSDKIKKILGKPLSNEKAVRAFSLTTAAGIMPRAYFIYGSPGETRKTIRESIDLLHRLRPLGAVFYMLVLFPGTHLYDHARQKGLVFDKIWNEKIEDLPWFELDETLDFARVKAYGNQLRQAFYQGLENFAQTLELDEDPSLAPFHADFLSRLAMTFFSGDYAKDPRIQAPARTAEHLFKRALDSHPDFRAFMGLGMLFQKQKKFEDGIRVMTRGLTHYPGSRDLCIGLGISFMNLGKFEQALDHFTPLGEDEAVRPYIDICQQKISG